MMRLSSRALPREGWELHGCVPAEGACHPPRKSNPKSAAGTAIRGSAMAVYPICMDLHKDRACRLKMRTPATNQFPGAVRTACRQQS